MHVLRESEKLLFACFWEVGEGRGKKRDYWTLLATVEQQVSELPPFLHPLLRKRTFVEVSWISSLLYREFHVFAFLKHEEERERGRGQEMKNHVGVVFLGWDSIFAVYVTALVERWMIFYAVAMKVEIGF